VANIYQLRREKPHVVVRKTRGDFLTVDRLFMRVWSTMLGPCCTAVYFLFCSMVNKEQRCWPPMAYIAKHVGFRKQSVMRAIRMLEFYGLVFIEKRAYKTSNIYVLVDKSRWKYPTKESGFARPEEFIMLPR
jgi:hypothetical protein